MPISPSLPIVPIVGGLLMAVSISGTFNLPDDDAGDTAFAHQAVQTLLGRRPHGVAEVQALTSLLASHTREEVVDALMSEPEFSEYWTTVLADTMKVQRYGDFTQNAGCFREPEYLALGGDPVKLADHIRDAAPNVSFSDGVKVTPEGVVVVDPADDKFNGNDAIQAAVAVDDLMVAWRPWLFAVAVKNQDKKATPVERRDNFLLTAFNLNTECISCHSSTYSTTEVYDGHGTNTWDRTASPGWDLERTAFSNGATALVDDDTNVWDWFTTGCSVSTCHGSDGTAEPAVGAFTSPKVLTYRAPLLTVEQIQGQILHGGGAMSGLANFDDDGNNGNDEAHAEELAKFLHKQLGSYEDIEEFTANSQFDHGVSAGPWGMDQSSSRCNFGWIGPASGGTRSYGLAGRAYVDPDLNDVIDALTTGLATMPSGLSGGHYMSRADNHLEAPAEPAAALATMLVKTIADRLVAEVMGSPLTLVHGLSRNEVQSTFLATVMHAMVVNADGRVVVSLKGALRSLVLSRYYDRRAPLYMAPSPDDPSRGAYQIPMAINPWAATADPSGVPYAPDSAGNNANGQGDLVHRRSPVQLLWSLHHDLGWPAPYVYPKANDPYPTSDFMEQIGRYRSDKRAGSNAWLLDSLLFWEAQVGACTNPDPAHPDFVSRLVAQPLAGSPGPKVKDLILVLKDRLLQEPFFTADEQLAIKTLLDAHFSAELGAAYTSAHPLTDPAINYSVPVLEGALRKYCGALLMSPDYLMAGLPTVTTSATPVPPYSVSLDGEPCSPGLACTVGDYTAHYTCALDGCP